MPPRPLASITKKYKDLIDGGSLTKEELQQEYEKDPELIEALLKYPNLITDEGFLDIIDKYNKIQGFISVAYDPGQVLHMMDVMINTEGDLDDELHQENTDLGEETVSAIVQFLVHGAALEDHGDCEDEGDVECDEGDVEDEGGAESEGVEGATPASLDAQPSPVAAAAPEVGIVGQVPAVSTASVMLDHGSSVM